MAVFLSLLTILEVAPMFITVITRHPEAVQDYLGFGARIRERGRNKFGDACLIIDFEPIEGRNQESDARWLEARLGSGMHGARITPDLNEWIADNGYTRCRHRTVNVVGNEETGVDRIRCEDCQAELQRRTSTDGYEYDYHTAEEWKQIDAERDACT
jgi:hypothetical protein